jgi:thiol-disulfide isomerase/thioredoxin
MSSHEIVYIGAKWCAPCKAVKPQVVDLAQKFNVPLTLLDYDDLEEEERGNVSKLPTIRVCDSGTVKEYTTNHVEQLAEWLRSTVRVNTTDDF